MENIKEELERKLKLRPKIIKYDEGRTMNSYKVELHWTKRGYPEDVNYIISYHDSGNVPDPSFDYQSWSVTAFNADKRIDDEIGTRNIIERWKVANYDRDAPLYEMFADITSYGLTFEETHCFCCSDPPIGFMNKSK